MRLVSFRDGQHTRLGAVTTADGHDVIVDLHRADPALPVDAIAFLTEGASARARAAVVLSAPPAHAIREYDVGRLMAPIPRPGKIICIGLNYRDHVAESAQAVPDYPTVFAKYATCVIGPREAIVLPRASERVDYEGELAVVIGRYAKDVPPAEALGYVAGYTSFNDVSARDYQQRTSQWTIGKTFDTFGPMGPALVTADDVPDPHNLTLRVTIGNDVLQESNTRHLIFSIPRLIAYLSAVMTLEPGDVIATGTPGGVGDARTPPRYLRPGEVVTVDIEGIGRLENPVVAADNQ